MMEPRRPALAGAVIAALLSSLPGVASAQQAETQRTVVPRAAATAAAPLAQKPVPPLRLSERPLSEVAAALTKATGVLVVADSSVAQAPITLETNGGSLSDILAVVAKQLPHGATLRHVALPAYKPMPQGDVIARFVSAQDAMKPAAGSAPPSAAPAPETKPWVGGEEIEILGQRVMPEQAAPLMAALNLRPAYLVSNPTAEDPVARSGKLQTEGLQLWMEMTPDQRRQAADNQLNGLLSMDSNARRALFGQMQEQAMGMMKKIQSLPPDQRAQFWRDVTGGKWDGTTPPAPGGGGGAGGGKTP
jgi:hypothetical protein